jgi:biopolymer transport protein ExbB
MKRTILLLVVALSACRSLAAQEISSIAATVQRDLEHSLKELSAYRETIAAEKVPLTKELSAREDELAALRREHDRVARAQDLSNLELANLKNEIKARQDEFTYISNLMDEFARGFETRINVSELQRYGPLMETAKLAPQNVDLSLAEKFNRQVALVRTSVARLLDLIGGTRFPGDAIDAQGGVAEGQFAMVGPVVLFATKDGHTAGVAVSQTGSTKPAVRPLEKKINVALATVVATGEGLLPVDPTRGGALRELIKHGSLIYYFKKGGPIMWPLLLASVLAVTVIIERLLFLARERRRRDPKAVEGIMGAVEHGDVEQAIRIGKSSQDFVARALTYALMHRQKSFADALLRAANRELTRFSRAIPLLDTIVTLSPLLGLLGTVTGMMSAFSVLGGAELGAPAQITGGIAEALIATAFGLGIAVTSLLPMNYLHTCSDNARHEMEDACAHLELLLKPILDIERALAQKNLHEKLARIGSAEDKLASEAVPGNPEGD